MSIVISNITKSFGSQKALNDVSFTVNAGTVVGFLGPNGAGKSTLMKVITGLVTPDSGKVEVEGIDVATDVEAVHRIVGYLPENNPLYLDMYVKEYLQFTAEMYQMPNVRAVVDDVIERIGLGPECRKKIGALSKGYRQRVGLAQAIIHNPKVLILDEPTTGLDPNQIIEIRNLILGLSNEKTILLSTHLMQEVQAICGKVAILNHGQLVANGPTTQMQQWGATGGHTLQVEFNADVDVQLLKQITNIVSVSKADVHTYLIEAAAGSDVRQDVFNFAVEHKLSVLTMQQKQNTIEEVFQKLTNK
mgnify:CR=1 FL=1